MKKFIKSLLLVLMTGLSITAFQPVMAQVAFDQDSHVDFHKYHTFAFLPTDVKSADAGLARNPLYNSDLINRNIQGRVQNELGLHGLTKNDQHPDLLISCHTFTERKAQNYYQSYPYYGGWGFGGFGFRGFGWGLPYYGYGSGSRAYTYTQGTLVVDAIDAQTHELVWRGSVAGSIDSPKRLERQIARGVHKVIKHYPVVVQS